MIQGDQQPWTEERRELTAVLSSAGFARSTRMEKLLSYLCERYFAGESDQIKEYNIGVEALGRRETFDPTADAIARVEVHRLRRKLREYYETEGAKHSLRISIPIGSYAPAFARVPSTESKSTRAVPPKTELDSVVALPVAVLSGIPSTPRLFPAVSDAAPPRQFRSLLNGVLQQQPDEGNYAEWKEVGGRPSTANENEDLRFANIVCKHLKSNAIALIKNRRLIGKGCGQTSRIDAVRQAIAKAAQFNFDLHGAVLASDAFFPFSDCVQIAHAAGITAFIQPGGSIRDKDSIAYCVENKLAMVITGMRHFKH